MENTRDLSAFGDRERSIAGELLTLLNTQNFLGDGVAVEFNPSSGKVFLVDEDYRVGVIEEGKVVEFKNCSNCGYEGTDEDYTFDKKNGNTQECCKEYFEN